MRSRLLISLCTFMLTTGCVTQGKYDLAMQNARTLDEQLQTEKAARTAAEQKVGELEEQVKGLEAEKEALNTRLNTAEAGLSAGTAERRALEQKNAELTALNQELARS